MRNKAIFYFLQLLFAVTTPHFAAIQKKSNFIKTPKTTIAEEFYNQGEITQKKGDFITSIKAFKQAEILFRKQNNWIKTADCHSSIAINYYYSGNYSKTYIHFDTSYLFYKKAKFNKGIVSILNNSGGLFYTLGNYPKALDKFKEALKYSSNSKEPEIRAAISKNIGSIYKKINQFQNALKYYQTALADFEKTKNNNSLAQCHNAISVLYIEQNNFKEAIYHLKKADKLATTLNDILLKTETLSNFGFLFYKKGDKKKSLIKYQQSLYLAIKNNNHQYIAENKIAIGKILFETKKLNQSIHLCQEGLKIAEKLGILLEKKEACECLYKAYKKKGKPEQALHYFEIAKLCVDSLQSETTSNKVLDMEYQKEILLDRLTYVKKKHQIQLKHREEIRTKEKQRNIFITSLLFICLIAIILWKQLKFVKKSKEQIQLEKDRSETLLLNILPEEIAKELKSNGYVSARDFSQVAILFTDFKSFTETAQKMTPQQLVEEINICFKEFDYICEKYNIEKIKTIGDSYMAAGGIPNPENYKLQNIVLAALEMQQVMKKRQCTNKFLNKHTFEMRIGIHAGPIVAGIVGVKKFQYDVWGDTVNTASRIESNGEVGKVNISETLYELIKDDPEFTFEYRGNIFAKGKGKIKMFFVNAPNLQTKNTFYSENMAVL